MNLDLTINELTFLARGCIMIEKSVGRKMKDGDISNAMFAVLTKEQNEVYVLRQKIAQGVLHFDTTLAPKKGLTATSG